jgi:hypothetical protein
MPATNLPSADDIRKRLAYDTDTGVFVWRRCVTMPNNWNARYAGAVAGCIDTHGYRLIRIDGRLRYAHRLAWLIVTGEWPADQIDHVSGNRADNRIANLRAVSHADNMRNAAMRADNTSGHMGVNWHKAAGKWRAKIKADGRDIHLGLFPDLSDAIAARKAAEITYGFHPNHGREA